MVRVSNELLSENFYYGYFHDHYVTNRSDGHSPVYDEVYEIMNFLGLSHFAGGQFHCFWKNYQSL